MTTRDHLFGVAATLQPVVQGVSDTRLDAPTPCADFDVRALVDHLLGTTEAMRRVGAREPMDTEDPWGTGGGHVREEWRRDLGGRLTALAEAWSQPDAWEGEAMDGAMPRALIGDMGFIEVMLHGWDLARGSGQDVTYDDAAVARALEILEVVGEQGRTQGAFGPEVAVPDDASDFARVLGRSGRDPGWTAG